VDAGERHSLLLVFMQQRILAGLPAVGLGQRHARLGAAAVTEQLANALEARVVEFDALEVRHEPGDLLHLLVATATRRHRSTRFDYFNSLSVGQLNCCQHNSIYVWLGDAVVRVNSAFHPSGVGK